jgi:phospho-N-acetylmuramoyl-pentapeptide-transferase
MPGELRDLPFALTLGAFTFVLVVMWGGPFVDILHRMRWGKNILPELTHAHQAKAGTPTSGGIIIVIPALILTFGLNVVGLVREGLTGQSILIPLFVMFGFGVLGFYDDYEGIRGGFLTGKGISARTKFSIQLLMTGVVVGVMSFGETQYANTMFFPLIPTDIALPRLFWIPMAMFIIVGTSNAVNFTDGMDGLAGIIVATAFASYGIIAFLQGQSFLAQFCFILVGACFGFLWYNAHPAQMFMGDVGSLALGAALGTVALMTGQWVLLPLIAIIPVAEVLSVSLQVGYFKATGGQRVFRKAPLHHHFEEGDWSETQVVQRFWLVAILSAMIGIALVLL